ncbi:MAG TPA: L,D-transpeptidase [Jatrophihabitans sp.]|jgi:lipoprotein-anchoring transpeptidase ErfK/SrfK|nr:L,D-transpeptidase [Jatrophihabitans sp.]
MNADELERRLRDAFDVRARSSVSEDVQPPAPRFAMPREPRRLRMLAPLAAAAAVLAVVGSMIALRNNQEDGHGRRHRVATAAASVHIRMVDVDNQTYGVGMPVVADFSRKFRTAKPLAAATSVTVDGKPVRAAWYFEHSATKGYPIAGHLRMRGFWPPHVTVKVTIAPNELTSAAAIDFRTGARTIAIVQDAKHEMVVMSDGKIMGSYPVSLGGRRSPTVRGIKVIMDKHPSSCLADVAGTYRECGIKYTQQLTYSGEYLHSAPWNTSNIQRGVDSSNGCTNLMPTDARLLYKTLKVGDVVEYPDADGPTMRADSGYGDWNVPWHVWIRGGLIPTS